jgi:hypothetical protein
MSRRSLIISSVVAAATICRPRRGWPIIPPPLPSAEPVDLLLVLAVDVSRSISDEEARLQSEGYRAALIDHTVLAAVRTGVHGAIGVAYVEWAGRGFQRLLVPWTRIADQADAAPWAARVAAPALSLADAAKTTGAPFAGTSIARGIDFSLIALAEAPWDAVRRVIDVSGDGVDTHGFSTGGVEAARDRAVREGVTINGLAIEGDPEVQQDLWPGASLADYYRASVVGGPGAFVVEADGFLAFRGAVRRKLVREIAEAHATAT